MNSATFNQTELAKYNGQGGQPAYVAVDGVVYDVTGVAAWAAVSIMVILRGKN